MALYELRTYTMHVGRLLPAIKICRDVGWPLFERKGYDAKAIGDFLSDTGDMNQLVLFFKFDDDADRRTFWNTLYRDPEFQEFGAQIQPLIQSQQSQLLQAAPWGTHP